jgi:threonine synthase
VPKAVGDFLILRAVRESGGFAMAVSDEELMAAVEEAARSTGCCSARKAARRWRRAEGAGAGAGRADERVVLFNCATGLKYPMPDPCIDVDTPSDHALVEKILAGGEQPLAVNGTPGRRTEQDQAQN